MRPRRLVFPPIDWGPIGNRAEGVDLYGPLS
jgi:hypothetical protein